MDPEPNAARQEAKRGGTLRVGPFLIAPAAAAALVGFCLIAGSQGPMKRFLDGPAQGYADTLAPLLLAVALGVYAVNAVVTRSPLSMVLVGLSAALLLREIHFEWTHRGIYALLAGVGVWAAVLRRRLAWPLADVRHTSWLLATLATYVLAFLLYRRAFRFVPGEETCHNFLEEGIARPRCGIRKTPAWGGGQP